MKFSAKEINIEVTPGELALLLAPGECIPAMQDETEGEKKDLHINTNIFLPFEDTVKITGTLDMENGVSESDTKEENTETEALVDINQKTILDIIAAGLAEKLNGRQVGIGYIAKDGAFKKEIQGEDGQRFVITMRRG